MSLHSKQPYTQMLGYLVCGKTDENNPSRGLWQVNEVLHVNVLNLKAIEIRGHLYY